MRNGYTIHVLPQFGVRGPVLVRGDAKEVGFQKGFLAEDVCVREVELLGVLRRRRGGGVVWG